MKPTKLLFLLILIGASSIFAQKSDNDRIANTKTDPSNTFVPGEFIVKFKATAAEQVKQAVSSGTFKTGISDIDALNTELNVYKAERVFKTMDAAKSNMELAERIGLTRVYLLSLPDAESIENAVARYAALPSVEYAEPNFIDHLTLASTDPTYESQWGLNNTGQAIPFDEGDPVGTVGADINAEAAWDLHTGDESVILAIIDTGVDYDHPEFDGKIVDGYDTFDEDDDPMDFTGHGTSCAGIAAAPGNNGIGIAGVNWNCMIMPIKIGADGSESFTHADGAEGMVWAADNGAHVLSCSYSGSDSQTKQDGVDYAYGMGCVILAARGNDNVANDVYPASYDNVISIGALSPCNDRKSPTTCDGEDWWGSNFTNIDVMAPGTRIHTTDITGAGGYDDGDYTPTFNGTSAACPFAAGVAALIRSYVPSLTVDEIAEAIRMSAVDIDEEGYDDNTGHGRLNAFAALNYAAGMVNNPPVALCQDVVVSADANCEGAVTAGDVDNGSYDPDGDEITISISPEGPFPLGQTFVTLTVDDENGGSSTCEATVTVVDDAPPSVTCPTDITVGNDAGECGAVVYFTLSASDNCDSDPMVDSEPASGSFFPVGTTSVVVSATDFSGNTDQCTFYVTVTDNEAPVITVFPGPIVLWPPNHKYHSFNLDDFVSAVDDNCSDLETGDVTITHVTSDEPEDDIGIGDGKTFNDIIINSDCQSIELRSERADELNGRVYTVYFSLTDDYGNTGTASFEVQVPVHPQDLSFDDGMVYQVVGICDYKTIPYQDLASHSGSGMTVFPNPFAHFTQVMFKTEVSGNASVKIFNSAGTLVATLFEGYTERGNDYRTEFRPDGMNRGIYFCQLTTPEGRIITRKLVIY